MGNPNNQLSKNGYWYSFLETQRSFSPFKNLQTPHRHNHPKCLRMYSGVRGGPAILPHPRDMSIFLRECMKIYIEILDLILVLALW